MNGEPCWSPDGAKIVFESNRDSPLHFGIYVMNADEDWQHAVASAGVSGLVLVANEEPIGPFRGITPMMSA